MQEKPPLLRTCYLLVEQLRYVEVWTKVIPQPIRWILKNEEVSPLELLQRLFNGTISDQNIIFAPE